MRILSSLLIGTALAQNVDLWPMNYENVGRAFQTYADSRTERKLDEIEGEVPAWVYGTLYRNGPAIYEYGEEKYYHFFDPTAILQGFRFDKGRIHYTSRYIESQNYKVNTEDQKIRFPEIGTYGEPDWVTMHEDGSLIEDEDQVKKNRIEFLIHNFPTRNSLVSATYFHGYILSMNESPFVHLHDPLTLEVIHELDLRRSKNKPDTIRIATITAHGMVDKNTGTWWNLGCGLDTSSTIPKVGYFVMWSDHAGFKAPGEKPSTPEEILDSIHFGPVINNPGALDLSISYYHSFSMTENYVIMPQASLVLNAPELLQGLINMDSLVDAMNFDTTRPTVFKIFNKNTREWERKEFVADPVMIIHTINAWEDDKGNIKLDTLLTGNPKTINMYTFDIINATGPALHENFMEIAPLGVPVQFEMDMNAFGNAIETEPRNILSGKDENFPCLEIGGFEFPVIDMYNSLMYDYDHYWSNGFGTTLPDRVFHIEKSTETRWVYVVEGYTANEPIFVKNPELGTAADDGVILTLMNPIYEDLRPYLAILNGRTLEEIAKAYLPSDIMVGTTFHGSWVQKPYEI